MKRIQSNLISVNSGVECLLSEFQSFLANFALAGHMLGSVGFARHSLLISSSAAEIRFVWGKTSPDTLYYNTKEDELNHLTRQISFRYQFSGQ